MRPFWARACAFSGGCLAVPKGKCCNVSRLFYYITMEKQIFTQEQAQEMYQTLCDFYDDFSHLNFKKMKKHSMIDYAYITGIGRLIEKIEKENLN